MENKLVTFFRYYILTSLSLSLAHEEYRDDTYEYKYQFSHNLSVLGMLFKKSFKFF